MNSEDQKDVNRGGTVYRAFIYKEKLYIFRKQATDIAQSLDIQNISKMKLHAPNIKVEEVKFEIVESESPPEEEETVKPDYLPVMSDKELGYLQKVERNAQSQAILNQKKINTRYATDNAESDNLNPKPVLENDDPEKPKGRQLNFSLKNSDKLKELSQLNKLKREEKKDKDKHPDTPLKSIKLPLKSSFSKDKHRGAGKEGSQVPSDSDPKVPEIKIGNLGDKTPSTNTLKTNKKK